MDSFFLSLKGGRGGRDWGRWTDRTRKGERLAAGRQRCDGGSGGEDSDREKVIESKHARTYARARTQRNFIFFKFRRQQRQQRGREEERGGGEGRREGGRRGSVCLCFMNEVSHDVS